MYYRWNTQVAANALRCQAGMHGLATMRITACLDRCVAVLITSYRVNIQAHINAPRNIKYRHPCPDKYYGRIMAGQPFAHASDRPYSCLNFCFV